MKTILVCNQKGGVGKSLVADEIAFSFERSGIPVSFYDLDTQGGTLHETHEAFVQAGAAGKSVVEFDRRGKAAKATLALVGTVREAAGFPRE